MNKREVESPKSNDNIITYNVKGLKLRRDVTPVERPRMFGSLWASTCIGLEWNTLGAIQIIRDTIRGRGTRQCHQITQWGGRVFAKVSIFEPYLCWPAPVFISFCHVTRRGGGYGAMSQNDTWGRGFSQKKCLVLFEWPFIAIILQIVTWKSSNLIFHYCLVIYG